MTASRKSVFERSALPRSDSSASLKSAFPKSVSSLHFESANTAPRISQINLEHLKQISLGTTLGVALEYISSGCQLDNDLSWFWMALSFSIGLFLGRSSVSQSDKRKIEIKMPIFFVGVRGEGEGGE